MSENLDLDALSDGELLDLAVPTKSLARRNLVMWLFLSARPQVSLEEWDSMLTSLAMKELQRRAASASPRTHNPQLFE